MAKSENLLQLSGTIAGLSFYKSGNTTIVRRPWGPDKKRMKKDPNYIRMRENGTEFGACVKAATLLRRAILPFASGKAYHRLSPRVNQLMFQLKVLDGFSDRGERQAGNGLKTKEGKALLLSFAFNAERPLEHVLKLPVETNFKKRSISLNRLLAKRDLKFPKGATHARLRAGFILLDFEQLKYAYSAAPEVLLSKKDSTRNLALTAPALTGDKSFRLLVLSIDFFQEVNGEIYSLADGEGCCCGVVGVSGF